MANKDKNDSSAGKAPTLLTVDQINADQITQVLILRSITYSLALLSVIVYAKLVFLKTTGCLKVLGPTD